MLAAGPGLTLPAVSERLSDDDVVASGVEIVEVEEAERLMAPGGAGPFSEGELRYALERVDPARRLAARLAAKRAAVRLLGGGACEREVEVERGAYGPPSLRLSGAAGERLLELGASRALVSLTHERRHAAALVLLLRGGW
jgi:holo-[acyl-carrier protein] synthase